MGTQTWHLLTTSLRQRTLLSLELCALLVRVPASASEQVMPPLSVKLPTLLHLPNPLRPHFLLKFQDSSRLSQLSLLVLELLSSCSVLLMVMVSLPTWFS